MKKTEVLLIVLGILVVVIASSNLLNFTGKVVSEECLNKYDLNDDKKVDVYDKNYIEQRIGNKRICSAENNFCNGDIDKNGAVEPSDLSLLTACLNGLKDLEECDVNGDGGVEPSDLSFLINILNGIEMYYKNCSTENNFCDNADLNQDGIVNIDDSLIISEFAGCESWDYDDGDNEDNGKCFLNQDFDSCPQYETKCSLPQQNPIVEGRINAEELDSSLYPPRTFDSSFYNDVFVYCDYYCNFENEKLCKTEQRFELYDGTAYWDSLWYVSDEEGKAWMNSVSDDPAFFDSYIVNVQEICEQSTICVQSDNTEPKIKGEIKKVFVSEKGNVASIFEIGDKLGNLKINSKIYNTLNISDNETSTNSLKMKIGSSKKVHENYLPKVDFDCEDIGLNFSKLPEKKTFLLDVSDDGKKDNGAEGEEKTASYEQEVMWCPEKLKAYSAYDVQLIAAKDLNGPGLLWWMTFYKKNEEVFPKMYKNLSYEIYFDENFKLNGKFNFYISTERRSDISSTREGIERAMSYGIVKIQDKLKGIGVEFPEGVEIAKWGCKKGQWKYDDVKNGSDTIKTWACSAYEDVKLESFIDYDFEKSQLMMRGGSGSSFESLEQPLDVPIETFIKLLDMLGVDRPSVTTEKNPSLKLGDIHPEDWTLSSYESPSNMTAKLAEVINLCSKKSQDTDAGIFKIKGISLNSKFLRNAYDSIKSFFGRLV